MEQIFKLLMGSRRTDKYSDVKQNLFSYSNAIYFAASPFNRLSTSTKSFLGLKAKKSLYC